MDLNLSSQITIHEVPENFLSPRNAYEKSLVTRLEKLPVQIFHEREDGAVFIAEEIAKIIRANQVLDQQCVMALPGGTTPEVIYHELVRKHQEEGLDFGNVVVFNLCDYFPNDDDKSTNYKSLCEMLFDHVNIPSDQIHTIPADLQKEDVIQFCERYEKKIKQYGGLDIALLGVGQSGNLAFNGPGSWEKSTTRLVKLDAPMQRDVLRLFGRDVSGHTTAITMGISTVMSAKHVFLTAWGDDKADIVHKCVEGQQTESVPATILQKHTNVRVFLDVTASEKLTRVKYPWLVASCEWTPRLIRAAIVWLSLKLDKSILKLTDADYRENGLEELLVNFGSAYDVNIQVFNDLQHTITGWPGGKPNSDDTHRPERANPFPKRVLIFSPHPDDDIISMGGTLQRLVTQGHDVHVAYETSGNIAVSDDEVTRFMHFINGFDQLFLQNGESEEPSPISKKYKEIKQLLKDKKQSGSDIIPRELLTIKGLIRRGEARLASTFSNIPLSHCHFLDLPFYETGRIKKGPLTEADVLKVCELIKEVKPNQVFIAGDLADPHGTHRVCTDAVLAALKELTEKGEFNLDTCKIWMYRGAWAEWPIEEIEMAVPLSPSELQAKKKAILKHQSQMDDAPFLGDDDRLFWQRSEDRNRGTADIYNKLGLADYEAIEAFVECKL